MSQALDFLRALDTDLLSCEFCYQCFDDSPAKRRELARVIHGRADDTAVMAELAELNTRGAGVFVTVNGTDGRGRRAENVTRLRAFFVDADDVEMPTEWHCTPSFIVRRDDRHWHTYWTLRGDGLSGPAMAKTFRDAQKRLAAFYGTDPAVCDVSRVMRMPGFMHCKGNPVEVQLVEANDARYTLAEVLANIPELPAGAPALPTPPAASAEINPKSTIVRAQLSDFERARLYVGKIPGASEGGRNNALFELVMYTLERFGIGEAELTELALSWAAGCSPALSEIEARACIRSAWTAANAKGLVGSKRTETRSRARARTEPTRNEVDAVPSNWIDTEFPQELAVAALRAGMERDAAAVALMGKLAMALPTAPALTVARVRAEVCRALDITKADFEHALREARTTTESDGVRDDGDGAQLAREYIRHMGAGRVLRYWRQEWYEWRGEWGCYRLRSDDWVKAEAGRWLVERGIAITTKGVGNFMLALRCLVSLEDSVTPPAWLDHEPSTEDVKERPVWIPAHNGIFNAMDDTPELHQHTPNFWQTWALPYDFDPTSQCPTFERCVAEWQPQQVAQDLIRKWIGYNLFPSNPHQKFLLNIGEVGGEAKTTLTAIMRALVGPENCGAVGLEAFDPSNRFGLAPLIGKPVNIVGDANVIDKMSEGVFKSITGGDPITIDRKNKQPVTVVLGTKFTINCNELPMFRDRSNAIWRRMLLLKWTPVPEDKIIPGLAEQIIESEISGVLNWALVGLHQLTFDQGFGRPDVVVANIREAQRTTQKELGFFEECVAFDSTLSTPRNPEDFVYTSKLVCAYQAYCREQNCPAMLYGEKLSKALRRWLRNHPIWGAEVRRLEDNGMELLMREGAPTQGETKRRWYYRGVRLLRDAASDGELLAG